MASPNFDEESRIYDVMSKCASRAAMSAAVQALALIQKEMADDPRGPGIMRLSGPRLLSESEIAILDSFDPPTLNKAWRKVLKSVDIAIGFVPELDRVARTDAILVRPGDIIRGEDPQGFANINANWEIEIDLGVVRGKVSW